MLHPYLHWSAADGTRLRGRTKVIERLQHAAPPVMPAAVELRDGQIYRWQEPLEATRTMNVERCMLSVGKPLQPSEIISPCVLTFLAVERPD